MVEILPQHEHAEIKMAQMVTQCDILKEQAAHGGVGVGEAAGALIAQAPWLSKLMELLIQVERSFKVMELLIQVERSFELMELMIRVERSFNLMELMIQVET